MSSDRSTPRAALLLAAASCANAPAPAPKPDSPAVPTPCDPRLSAAAQPGYHLWRAGPECVGWTIDTPYHFGDAVELEEANRLIDKIVDQNKAVAQPGATYVRVVVMVPMTPGDGMIASGIENALRGVYGAQMRAADPDESKYLGGSNKLGIQVVLANEGTNSDQWRAIVDELADPNASQDHRVIAFVGLGASLDATQNAAVELSKHGMPAIGAVLTAKQITGTSPPPKDPAAEMPPAPTLGHVAPSNDDLVRALGPWVDRNINMPAYAVLVKDRTPNDPYLDSLYGALSDKFGGPFELASHYKQFDGSRKPGDATPNLNLDAAHDIRCGRTDLVFYSGRGRDLRGLINNLTGVEGCLDHPVTVAAETTGLDVLATDGKLAEDMRRAKVSVVEAMVTDYQGWIAGRDAPPYFRPFYDYYLRHGYPRDALADGYTIMYHDAVTTAIAAARRLFGFGRGQAKINAANVGNAIANFDANTPLPLASGALYFGDIVPTGGRPHHKPVPLIEWPAQPGALPLPPVYYTS